MVKGPLLRCRLLYPRQEKECSLMDVIPLSLKASNLHNFKSHAHATTSEYTQ